MRRRGEIAFLYPSADLQVYSTYSANTTTKWWWRGPKKQQQQQKTYAFISLNVAWKVFFLIAFSYSSACQLGQSCSGFQCEWNSWTQLDWLTSTPRSVRLSLRLGVELCVHCYVPEVSNRMRSPRRRALLFNRLLFFHCHCNVIKCVSPCQKDLNLSAGVYCLIQHKFPGWGSKENT